MVRDIRGLGLMIAVELRTKVAPVLKSLMLNHGVIALAGRTDGAPPAAAARDHRKGNRPRRAGDRQGDQGARRPDGSRGGRSSWCADWSRFPSLSRHEAAASAWLVEQMRAAGYDRAFVDEAGNAVGELGDPSASRTIVLLGHIDTVPGNIPVRIEAAADGDLLFGRGSVDAKGPLATFVAGAARFGSAAARGRGLRVVVVGAVEEEAATSKGARFIAARFDGTTRADPDRVHHRRAESLESRHARLQGPAAARLHRRSADGAHRRSRRQRRVGRRRLTGTGSRRTPRASTTARTRSSIS